MLIEIRGIGFPNKGAELMLIAVMEQVKTKYPHAEFVVEMDANFYLTRAKYGLYQKIWHPKLGLKSNLISAFIPYKLKKALGIKDDKEVDIIIDASGFRYTKQWGLAATNIFMANHIEHWRKKGKKIIFMPQAWGPFDEEFKSSITKIIKNSDLLIARDNISKENIEKLTGIDGVKCSPDFSNLLQPKSPEIAGIHLPEKSVAIIPNCRMLDKMTEMEATNYPLILQKFITNLKDKGYEPFFLMHEGKGDEAIAIEVNEKLGQPILVLGHEDPLILKGILSKCDLVIGSRFHGLVSALSTGVPVISMGWSHKYNVLMQDYGLSEYLIESCTSLDQSSLVLDAFINELPKLRRSVLEFSKVEKEKSRTMWKDVFEVMES